MNVEYIIQNNRLTTPYLFTFFVYTYIHLIITFIFNKILKIINKIVNLF